MCAFKSDYEEVIIFNPAGHNLAGDDKAVKNAFVLDNHAYLYLLCAGKPLPLSRDFGNTSLEGRGSKLTRDEEEHVRESLGIGLGSSSITLKVIT